MNKNKLYTNTWKRKSINPTSPEWVKKYVGEIAMTVAYNEALIQLAKDGHCVAYELDEYGDKYMKNTFVYRKGK
jgi:hypothetical protein